MAHTPGPWVSGWGAGLTGPTTRSVSGPCCGGKDWGSHPVSCGTETIAICPEQREPESRIQKLRSAEENARLIAAAPDLLEALEELSDDVFGRQLGSEPNVYSDYDRLLELEAKCRAAIAKATGAA